MSACFRKSLPLGSLERSFRPKEDREREAGPGERGGGGETRNTTQHLPVFTLRELSLHHTHTHTVAGG